MRWRRAILGGWCSLLSYPLVGLVLSPMQGAFALTQRDLIPIGLEFCMIATEDPERATSFAIAHDFVASQRGDAATLFSPSADVQAPFMGVTVHRHEDGSFAIECGFDAQAVGDVSGEEVAGLAQRFGLEVRGNNETYVMTRRTPHLIVLGYLSVTNEWPCPEDGRVEVAPEALDSYLQICGRPGLRLQLQSTYSPTEIPGR